MVWKNFTEKLRFYDIRVMVYAKTYLIYWPVSITIYICTLCIRSDSETNIALGKVVNKERLL